MPSPVRVYSIVYEGKGEMRSQDEDEAGVTEGEGWVSFITIRY